jgi:hypothetical protein
MQFGCKFDGKCNFPKKTNKNCEVNGTRMTIKKEKTIQCIILKGKIYLAPSNYNPLST